MYISKRRNIKISLYFDSYKSAEDLQIRRRFVIYIYIYIYIYI